MVKVMDIRIRAVILSTEVIKTDREISSSFGISERTLRRGRNPTRFLE